MLLQIICLLVKNLWGLRYRSFKLHQRSRSHVKHTRSVSQSFPSSCSRDERSKHRATATKQETWLCNDFSRNIHRESQMQRESKDVVKLFSCWRPFQWWAGEGHKHTLHRSPDHHRSHTYANHTNMEKVVVSLGAALPCMCTSSAVTLSLNFYVFWL